jgi:NitT/TauT family transport system permease protein
MSTYTVTDPTTGAEVELDVTTKEKDPERWKWRAISLTVVVAFLVIWELLPRLGLVSQIILPPVTDVWAGLVELVQQDTFPGHLQVTLVEMLLGFLIGTFVGFAIGVALGVWESVKKSVYPLVVSFQSLPKIVLAPLLITWFGYGIESKIAMAVVIAFFPVLINTMVGLESVPDEARQLMRSLRSSRGQVFRKLSLPHAAPFIMAGIKTGLTFAVIGAIVGEFVGSSEGLGYLLHAYSFQLRIDKVFAVIVILSAVGAILYFAIDWLERRMIYWRSDNSAI